MDATLVDPPATDTTPASTGDPDAAGKVTQVAYDFAPVADNAKDYTLQMTVKIDNTEYKIELKIQAGTDPTIVRDLAYNAFIGKGLPADKIEKSGTTGLIIRAGTGSEITFENVNVFDKDGSSEGLKAPLVSAQTGHEEPVDPV